MTKVIRIPYRSTPKAILEAMNIGSGWVMGGWRWPMMVAALVVILLICMGGAGAVVAIVILGGNPPQTAPSYVWIGALLAGVFFLIAQNMPLRILAQRTATSPYGRGEQTALFDAKGMTIQNAHSIWQTDWVAIENLKLGKKAIVLQVAGVAFSVPLSAVDDPAAVMQQLDHWKQAA
ncbi:hypothetical protein [Loktanella sp. Alg231-35]|uniref:hypothetical protein n=1 Tax=Loktanella sp. Alg231-35 TaxID=1922220 RepID=UPI00131F41A5|nr:hypothetical protein [Loktanella sp. Alg231-35]